MATTNKKSSLGMLGAQISEAVNRQKERRRRTRAERIAARAIQGLGLEPLESRVLLSVTGAFGVVALVGDAQGNPSSEFSSDTGHISVASSGSYTLTEATSVDAGTGSADSASTSTGKLTFGAGNSFSVNPDTTGYSSIDSNIGASMDSHTESDGSTNMYLLLREGSGLSDTTVSGNYSVVDLGISQDNNNNSGLDSTIGVGSVAANGMGSMTGALTQVAQGQASGNAFTPGPANFTYSVASNGQMTFGNDGGWVSSDGSIFIFAYQAESDYVEVGFAVRQTTGHSVASLDGKYYLEGFDRSDTNNSVGVGDIDFNGKGGFIGAWTGVAEGQGTANVDQAGALSGTYTVSDDGQVVITYGNGNQYTAFLNADNTFGAWASLPGDAANFETGEGVLIQEPAATIPPISGSTKLVFASKPANTTAGVAMSDVVVKIEDAKGEVETGDSAAVSLSIASGPGAFTGSSTTTVNAVDGVATFNNLAIDTAGTYTLAVADATDSLSNFKSSSFKTTPAGLASVDFVQEPTASAVAGKKISPAITVEAEDAFGNGISGQTIKLALATSPAGAVSPGTLTAKTSSTGIAAFSNLILHTAGAYTLVASDGSISSAPSSSILLTPAAPAKLVFTAQPANSTAGSPLAPVVVKIVDLYGNLEAGDDSVVTLSIATGPRPAAFTGSSTTAVNAVGGVATFNNLTLDTAGAYGLDGADSADKLGKTPSGKFEIAPAAVGSVAFVKQPPSSVVAGKTIAPSITVVVKDAFGNPLSGATVTLAVDTGPSGGTLIGVTQAVTSKAGVATFSGIFVHVAGTYTLIATNSDISSAASNNVVVAPAKALTMSFSDQPPSTVGTGGTFSVAVAYLDTYGNIATSVNGAKVKLSLAVSPAGATLGGTAIVTVVNGVATFSGLSLNTAGTYQFIALGSLMDLGATSSSFMVGSLAFTATSPVAADNAVTLQALGLGTSSSNVQSIDFYWDPTGAGTTTGAVLLGTSNAEANWMLTATLPRTTDPVHPFPTSGSATFVAQAVETGGSMGNIQTVVVAVEAQPTIGTLTISPLSINPSDQTGQIIFTAGSVSSVSNVVTEVQFWLAPVGATVLAPDISKLLGVGVSVEGTADWTLTLPDSQLNFTLGTHIVWARAQDASGIWSEAVSGDLLIESNS